VREQLGLGFMEAIKWLEQRFALPPLPFQEGDAWERPESAEDIVAKQAKAPTPEQRAEAGDGLLSDKTFEEAAKIVSGILDMVTEDRILALSRATAYWEAFDRVLYMVTGKGKSLNEDQGVKALEKIRNRVMAEIRGA